MKIPCPAAKLSPEEMLEYFRANKDWRPGKEIKGVQSTIQESKGSESSEKETPKVVRRYEVYDRGKDQRNRYGVRSYEREIKPDGTTGPEGKVQHVSSHSTKEFAQNKATELGSYLIHREGVPKSIAENVLGVLKKKYGGFKDVEVIPLSEAREIDPLHAEGRQGFYKDGRTYIIHDNIDVTSGDIDRAKRYGGTPDSQAALRVLTHENVHHLIDFIRKDPSLLKEYQDLSSQIPEGMIKRYRDQGIIKNPDAEGAQEEFVALWSQSRMFRDALKEENPSLFRKILDFFKKVYNKFLGIEDKPLNDDDMINLLQDAHEMSKVSDPVEFPRQEAALQKIKEIAEMLRLQKMGFNKRAPEEKDKQGRVRDELTWAGKAARELGMEGAKGEDLAKGPPGEFPPAPEEKKDPSTAREQFLKSVQSAQDLNKNPESKGSEKSEEPAGTKGRKKTGAPDEEKEAYEKHKEAKRPLTLDAETGEKIERVAKKAKDKYKTVDLDEEGAPVAQREEKLFKGFDFKKSDPHQKDYEKFVAQADPELVRLDQYLGNQIANYDVKQPLVPMVDFVREQMGLEDSVAPSVRLDKEGKPSGLTHVSPERTEDVLRIMKRLLGKTGRAAEEYQQLFRESSHAKDANGNVIHQGAAVPGIVQMEGMKYLESVWQDIAMDHARGTKRYSPSERSEIWNTSRSLGKYANKLVLQKYLTISDAARHLQARSAASRGLREQSAASIIWDSLHAQDAGIRDAAEQAVGDKAKTGKAEIEGLMDNLGPVIKKEFWEGEGDLVSKKKPEDLTKEQKELFDLIDEDKISDESILKNSAKQQAKESVEERQQSTRSKERGVANAAKDANDIAKQIKTQEDESKGTSSKGAKKQLSEKTPEQQEAALKRAVARVKDLMREIKNPGAAKETRKNWFGDAIREWAKDHDPKLAEDIAEFESREAVRDSAKDLEKDIHEQIKNPVSKEQFSAELQDKYGMSKELADRQADNSTKATQELKRQGDERAKSRAASDPEKLIRSKRFINTLMDSIFSAPEELRSNPQWREDQYMETFLGHGLTEEQAKRASELFGEQLHKAWEQANRQAVAKVYKMLGRKGDPSYDTLKAAARVGLFDPGNSVMVALAHEAGFNGISHEDYLKLGLLDWKMSWHDPRMKSKYERDWYRILAAARMPKTALQIATQSFVNNALSGMTTMGLHWLSPAYITLRQVGLDMLRAGVESKGDIAETFGRWHASMDAMIDSYKNTLDEAKFALKYDTTSEGIEVLNSAYSMEQDHNKAKSDIQKALKEKNHLALLGATTRYVATSTDIVRRILASGFQTWGSNMHDFVLQSESMRDLTQKAGLSAKAAHALLESAVAEAPGLVDEMIRAHGEKPEDYTPLELSAMQRDKAAQRMATVASEMISPENSEAKYKDLMDTAKGGFQTEQGTYQGEGSPMWDVPSQLTEMVKSAAQAMRKKNELLGRIMMGFLTVPANVVNRSFYFTPWGILRAMGKQKGWKGFDEYYQTTQKTQALSQMRMAEGVVGSIGMGLIASLMLNEDKDKPVFNVTGSGPKDKNLRDAWEKQGHHTNSVELQVGDKIVAIPYGRAGLEGMQIPMAALGALDDAKLNSSDDPKKAELLGQYAHYAYTNLIHEMGSVATGGGLSGSITGSDIRNSAFWSMKAAAFVPYSSALRSAFKLIGGDLDQSTVQSAVESQIPFTMPFGSPALNALGDPIRSRPVDLFPNASERLYGQGLPIFLGIPGDSADVNLYRLFQQKGKGPSSPSFQKMENDYGMDLDEYQKFLIKRGQIVKSSMRARMAELRQMGRDDFSKTLSKIESEATTSAIGNRSKLVTSNRK